MKYTIILTFCLLTLCLFNSNSYQNKSKDLPYVDSILEKVWEVQLENNLWDYSLVKNNIVFFQREYNQYPYGNFSYAIDGLSGEKLYYDTPAVQERFRKTFEDSLIAYTFVGSMHIQNIYTGEIKTIKESNIGQQYNIQPYFIKYNTIYTIENDTILVAKTPNDLSIKWKFTCDEIVGNFKEYNNTLFFSTSKTLYRINIETGEKLAEFPIGKLINSVTKEDKLFALNHYRFSGETCNTLNIIDTKTNDIIKEIELKKYYDFSNDDQIYLINDTIYFSNSKDNLFYFSLRDLNCNLITSGYYSFYILGDYFIYYEWGGPGEVIIQLSNRAGEVKYQRFSNYKLNDTDPLYLFASELVDNRIIVGYNYSDKKIYAYKLKQ